MSSGFYAVGEKNSLALPWRKPNVGNEGCGGLPLRSTTTPVGKSCPSAKSFEISRCWATTGFGQPCVGPICSGANTA